MAKKRSQSTKKRSVLRLRVTDYGILLGGVSLCLLGFFLSWPFVNLQRLWIFNLATFYVFWGCWHHYKTDASLSPTVFAEYIGVAALVAATLFFALSY